MSSALAGERVSAMFRVFGKTIVLVILIGAGSLLLFTYARHDSLQQQVEQLQESNRQQAMAISRLKTERRVAKILVTDQRVVDGKLRTTLLFEEFRKNGTPLPAKQFVIDGNEAHFDAEVIKFKDQYVEQGDPLRGQSIMLFVRVYGAHQAPADGFPIDVPGTIPEIYRGSDPKVSSFEQDLWKHFWTLFNDRDAREARGIRGMNGEGLYGQFDRNHVYTITLRPDGGTIQEEPIEPIYGAALQDK